MGREEVDEADLEESAIRTLVREYVLSEKKKRGLWDNIWAKRRRGERPAKPGEKGYPKTLDIEEGDLNEAALTVKGLKKTTFEEIQKKFPDFAKILQSKYGDELSSASFAFSSQGMLGMSKIPVMVTKDYQSPVVYWEDKNIKYNSSTSLADAVRDAK